MGNDLFRPGGPYNIRRGGGNEFTMSVPLPADEQGMTARECPQPDCAPGYFKVRLGTGVTEPGNAQCWCPYCGSQGEKGSFLTHAQRSYAKSVVLREAQSGVQRMIKDAFGLDSRGRRRMGGDFLSIELSLKQSPPRPVVMPYEEELRRNVTCPDCTLAHAVFGIAVWCPDCGNDIFLTHVAAELDVVRKVLGEVGGRTERLGPRVAARDIENALEDAVSAFEAVLKFTYKRSLIPTLGEEQVERKLRGLGNAFQNPVRAAEILRNELYVELEELIGCESQESLWRTIQKRHPITHNLGVVDRKYLEQGGGIGGLGREVPLTAREVEEAVNLTERVLAGVYTSLFPS